LQYIGRINKSMFEKISNKIITDEVVLTEKQRQHIKERHPNDYEQYYMFLKK